MAGSSTPRAAAKTAAAKQSPVGTREGDPMDNAHPLVGVAGVAEQVGGPRTAEEQRAAIRKEYGEFVAVAAITHDGALAYNVGDAVPASNVKAWNYDGLGLVKRRATKAAAPVVGPGEGGSAGTDVPDPTDPDAPVG